MLKDSARGSSGERGGRFRATLIVAEVALSVVLLVGSSLLLISFLKLQRTPPGFEAKGAATAFVGVPASRYHDAGAAGATSSTRWSSGCAQRRGSPMPRPRSGCRSRASTRDRRTASPAGRSCRCRSGRSPNLAIVSDDYFTLMRIRFAAGRAFTADDREGAPGVCIINESLAKRLFPGESPLGKVLLRGRDAEIRARDRRRDPRREDQRPQRAGAGRDLLSDAPARRGPGMDVVARTTGDPAALQAMIRDGGRGGRQGSADFVLRHARDQRRATASAPSASSRR